MTKERAIEILTNYHAWLSNNEGLYWSASEVNSAIRFAEPEFKDENAATIIREHRNWIEFGQPFFHTLEVLNESLIIAVENLKK
jgi:hypothetical protein